MRLKGLKLFLIFAMLFIFIAPASAAVSMLQNLDISYYRLLKTDNYTDEDAARIENIIRYFADAVYESSNGSVCVGTVRIFQAGAQSLSDYKQADVVWTESGHPKALAGAGLPFSPLKQLGQRAYMYDVFDFQGNATDFLADEASMARGGYALASLMSSYWYNLRAEYPLVRNGQTFAGLDKASVMNNPMDGSVEALNYSSAAMYTEDTSTEQAARWGASGWEMLTERSPLQTPPGKGKEYSLQLKGTEGHNDAAQKYLNIVWVSSPIYMLTIDVSGSMDGERIAKAKAAAKDYVNNLTVGKRAGIITFSNQSTLLAPITRVTEENMDEVKQDFLARIDSITAGGGTAMYEACIASIDEIIKQPGSEYEGKYVVLFSDGADGGGNRKLKATVDYAASNNVSINPIGLENGVDIKILQELAESSGGQYLLTSAPIDTQEMLFNYFSGENEVQSSVQDIEIAAGASGRASFNVTPNTWFLRASVITDRANIGSDIGITARTPGGNNIEIDYDPSLDKHEIILEEPEIGSWTLTIKNGGRDARLRVSTYETMDVEKIVPFVQVVNGKEPGEVIVYASVTSGGLPITGMTVTGEITGNGISPVKLDFNDRGLGSDILGEDGIYTAVCSGALGNGNYRAAVSFNGKGAVATVTPRFYYLYPGSEFKPSDKQPADGNFERAAVSVFQIKNGMAAENLARVPMEGYVNYKRLFDIIDRGERALQRSAYDQALSYSNDAIRIWPEYYRIYFLRGQAYDWKKDFEGALLEFREAVMLAPYSPEAYYRYGQAFTVLKDAEGAAEVLYMMKQMFPNNKWTSQLEMAYKLIDPSYTMSWF